MIYSKSFSIICLGTIFIIVSSCKSVSQFFKYSGNKDYIIATYIWPSCHHDERFGDMLWPDGEGEWEIIKKGTPRFDGHYQPKQPLWGYEKDNDSKVMEKWINLATAHGVNTFIFDWYWFDDGPFLESSLNDGFLQASNNEKMNFYIMWANHDVKRNYWNPYRFTDDESILWKGPVNRKEFENVVERVIVKFFCKKNYLKIEGSPVFYIFDLNNFVKGLGGLQKSAEALEYFRSKVISAGYPDLHLQVRAGGTVNPSILSASLSEGKNINQVIQFLKINSVTKYGWGHHEDYLALGKEIEEKRLKLDSTLNVPYFPNISIGWDDTPRFLNKGRKDVTSYNQSPESFAYYLHRAKEYCDQRPNQPKLITIFAWNEWVEGSYLLPDTKYGFQYLEKLKVVMDNKYLPH